MSRFFRSFSAAAQAEEQRQHVQRTEKDERTAHGLKEEPGVLGKALNSVHHGYYAVVEYFD